MSLQELLDTAKTINNNSVGPIARDMDKSCVFDKKLFKILGDAGILGMNVQKQYGGTELSAVEMGLLHEEFGSGYLSVENAITVFCMVGQVLQRCGSIEQRQNYLPGLASGQKIGAFALTEEEHGSDFAQVKTTLSLENDNYILNGRKKWITLGEIADFFIVFTRFGEGFAVCIVENSDSGFSRKPIVDTLGLRANMLSELHFENCILPKERIICTGTLKPKITILSALNLARFTTASGAVGLAIACCREAFEFARSRKCGEQKIGGFQLVKKLMSEMHSLTQSAKLICRNAGETIVNNENKSLLPVLTAKYVASKAAVEVSNKAVQIFAAQGVSNERSIERLYRDSRILEIVEGSTQIHEIMIGSELIKEKYESL